ncbi:hypothetical protein EOL96_02600 [Candidatus Saccharibacteria bacterium]|nr:hypothetical protein [Candidatus Saccharibacteria bacterium]
MKHLQYSNKTSPRTWLIARIPLVAGLLLPSLLAWGFISYNDQQQQAYATQLSTDQSKMAAEIDAQVKATLQKRIDDARKAEEEAKAKAEEEAKARAALTQPTVPLSQTASPTNCGVAQPSSLQVIINKKHCYSPLNYSPPDLVSVDDVTMRSEAASQYAAMKNAAAAAGQSFSASSSYRSYDTQIATYNYWVGISGSVQADTYSARAGYSEHQSGLAVDVKAGGCALSCFTNTTQYAWLKEHAAEFGFIERYPAGLTSITGYTPESWHWRYIGIAVAQDMKTKGIQTLEQYYRVEGGDYA